MATEAQALIDELNAKYSEVHRSFEDNFWSTKMALPGASVDELTRTKNAYEAFLRDEAQLARVRAALAASSSLSESQKNTLRCMEKTFGCYIMEDATARTMKEELTALEGALEAQRNGMKLGYEAPDGSGFVQASSVLLRTRMRTERDEATRRACFEASAAVGPAVAPGLARIAVLRNRMARALGYPCFFDYKVTQAEGFGKKRLFEILDGLEQRTRPVMQAARAWVADKYGAEALQPWNLGFATAGDVTVAQDPYFPFEDAVEAWARSFAALGIRYEGSTMRLDLCDRANKYSNGFCHWPVPTYVAPGGARVPSAANFTSLATPSAPGSGHSALVTLMHEGGHAAHFANVCQPSPFFSQERAPTSVAYAETQSMLLDALVDDAAWLGRYARSRGGEPMPWHLVEAGIRAAHPTAVLGLRAMLAVCYFEKALYEMSEEQMLAPGALERLAAEVETRIQGGPSPRPLLTVPHILSDESSCYYQGYVLAEMAVHQTRAHFKRAYGHIVDNPRVGADLAKAYWAPGNGAPFLDLVQQLTGAPLSSDAWVASLSEDLEALVTSERAEYDAAVKAGPALPPGGGADIGMRCVLVHGAEVIADSGPAGGADAPQRFAAATAAFKAWVRRTYFDGK